MAAGRTEHALARDGVSCARRVQIQPSAPYLHFTCAPSKNAFFRIYGLASGSVLILRPARIGGIIYKSCQGDRMTGDQCAVVAGNRIEARPEEATVKLRPEQPQVHNRRLLIYVDCLKLRRNDLVRLESAIEAERTGPCRHQIQKDEAKENCWRPLIEYREEALGRMNHPISDGHFS